MDDIRLNEVIQQNKELEHLIRDVIQVVTDQENTMQQYESYIQSLCVELEVVKRRLQVQESISRELGTRNRLPEEQLPFQGKGVV